MPTCGDHFRLPYLSSFSFGKRTIAKMKVVNFGCYIPDIHWKTDEN
jgi:hypothetical protein